MPRTFIVLTAIALLIAGSVAAQGSMRGRVPRGGVGTVDLRQDRVQVRRPVLAS